MIGAEVEHGKGGTGVDFTPAPWAAPLWGYPADSSARAIITARRLRKPRPGSGRRRRGFLSFAQTFSFEQENFRVFHQPVGDGGGDGGVVQNVAPLGEGGV